MNTITSSFSKVLTLAVVALTVIVTLAVNPGEALARNCCPGHPIYLDFDSRTCEVEDGYGYEFTQAYLSNKSNNPSVVEDNSKKGEYIILSQFGSTYVPLTKKTSFSLLGSNGPVYFYCSK
ncbi:MAG: hypothetical protein F6K26_48960 [Moorea sp. SIO2I5]|nr:hypothetical protein [Moorena sp. SIO2I5]